MATVRDENGIERFVLCDLSAPSQWVRATATNGAPKAQAPEGNEAAVDGVPTTQSATDLLVDCMQAMKRQMDTMTERMEAMQADQARLLDLKEELAEMLELQEVDQQIALAEQHEAECEAETKRLEGELLRQRTKRIEATARLQDLRRYAKDLRRAQVSTGEDYVARRVRVWWTAEREFFDGTVMDQRAARNGGQELFIEYNDGDKIWHNTEKTRIVEITEANAVSPLRPFRTRSTAERLTHHTRLH